MYTIKRAAELTGVPAATLRAWERRYDVVEPRRTDAGYRLYDDAALERLRTMAGLVADGWTASTAAAEVGRRTTSPPSPTPAQPAAAPGHEHTTETESTQRLLDAAGAMDPTALADVLDERFSLGSFERVVDDWLMPALEEVGRAWADGRISVAGEHLVAHAVLRRLAAVYDAAASRTDGPTAIIGLPAGVHHELGIFAFAVALRRRGISTVYLGPDLPAPAWSAALEAHDAGCVVLSAPSEADLPAAREVVTALRSTHGLASVFVGGGRQEDVTDPGVTHLGHAIGPAAARVASALTA